MFDLWTITDLIGGTERTMQRPCGWWLLNQQKSPITASSEQVSLETERRGRQQVIDCISGVHPHMYEKNIQKGHEASRQH